jgi:sulfofructose kinase
VQNHGRDPDRHVLCAGLTAFDVVQLYREHPDWGAKGTAEESYADVGGPAANAAVTVALLGGRVRLATVLGGGGLVAELVRSRLARLGVEAIDLGGVGTEPPISSIWVDRGTGSRTVISTNRATVGSDAVSGAVAAVDAGTAAVLVDGHLPVIGEAVVRRAAALGIPVVLDGGSWKPVLERILPDVSVAILSSDFAVPGGAGARGFDQARLVRERFGVREVVVTRGERPVLSLSEAGEETIPVPAVAAVDTLGAGDVFHGAYLHFRYLVQQDHLEALRLAARVAAESCAHNGTRAGVQKIARELA